MSIVDDDVTAMLTAAAGAPVLAQRKQLLDELTARIEAGGADVADAPTAPPVLMPVPSRHARTARIAGIGLIGWAGLALGSAAAATGAWVLLGHEVNEVPVPAVTTTPPPATLAAQPEPAQPEPAQTGAAQPTTAEAGTEASTPRPSARPGQSEPAVARPEPSPVHSVTALVKDPVEHVVQDTVTAVQDTVTTVEDTLAPVLGAIQVKKTTDLLTGLVNCATTVPLSVTATDDVAVTSVTATVTTASGLTTTVPLHATGDTWNGGLATMTLSTLLGLGSDVTVSIEAQDAAGNSTTATTLVKASVLACS